MDHKSAQTRERDGRGSTAGPIIHTPGAELPYGVELTQADTSVSNHAFATMREAEDFIRRNTPVPAERSTAFDQPAEKG
jgi:hypothetical protein